VPPPRKRLWNDFGAHSGHPNPSLHCEYASSAASRRASLKCLDPPELAALAWGQVAVCFGLSIGFSEAALPKQTLSQSTSALLGEQVLSQNASQTSWLFGITRIMAAVVLPPLAGFDHGPKGGEDLVASAPIKQVSANPQTLTVAVRLRKFLPFGTRFGEGFALHQNAFQLFFACLGPSMDASLRYASAIDCPKRAAVNP
jgi:hypothetical protein